MSKTSKSVLMISYHLGEVNAAGAWMIKVCRGLTSKGIKLTICCRSVDSDATTANRMLLRQEGVEIVEIPDDVPQQAKSTPQAIPQLPGPLATVARNKMDALFKYTTGFDQAHHQWVQQAFRETHKLWDSERYDVCFSRLNHVRSHHVALKLKHAFRDMPWVAHYSDPWPVSNYPPPYYSKTPWPIDLQHQKLNRQVLLAADAITVPWASYKANVLGDLAEKLDRKVFVVHQPNSILDSDEVKQTALQPAGEFVLLHAGQLLTQRSPDMLIAAYETFLKQCPRARENSRLRFLGKVNPQHKALHNPGNSSNIQIHKQLPYMESIREMENASVLLLVEAVSSNSIFFPSKLADYLAFPRPILALTSPQSAVSEVLAGTPAVIVDPEDEEAILNAITKLYVTWEKGSLMDFAIDEELRAQFTASHSAHQLVQALDYAIASSQACSKAVAGTTNGQGR